MSPPPKASKAKASKAKASKAKALVEGPAPKAGVAPVVGVVRRAAAPELGEEPRGVGDRLGQVVGVERAQHRVVLDGGVEAGDQVVEERTAADPLVEVGPGRSDRHLHHLDEPFLSDPGGASGRRRDRRRPCGCRAGRA